MGLAFGGGAPHGHMLVWAEVVFPDVGTSWAVLQGHLTKDISLVLGGGMRKVLLTLKQ